MYHIILFCTLFLLSVGGGSVQNDAYIRFKQFIELEKNGELEFAKNNLEKYNSMLKIDLKEFNNSNEFKKYLKGNDASINTAEAIFIAWLFAFLVEISMIIVTLINILFLRLRLLLKINFLNIFNL